MYNEFGKFLRHLRLDRFETMKEMADKFKVSTAFLSAVENGNKKIPQNWFELISEKYGLDSRRKDELEKAIIKTNEKVEIDLKEFDLDKKNVSIMFARRIKKADPVTLEKLKKLLDEKS